MVETITSHSEWMTALQNAWGAVPAGDLLLPSSGVWASLGLNAPDVGEAASFATTGRALKYGQSMAVALPVMGGESVTRLMVYLHRIRLDALQGGIRAPWLNSENVERHPDIVFISRPRMGFQDISRVAALHARVLRPATLKERKSAHTSQTLVVDGSVDLMELTDLIAKGSRPFVLVVDGSRGGNDNSWALDSALEECFPQTPRIVLLSLGDNESLSKMRLNRTRTHLWVMRLADKAALNSPISTEFGFQQALIGDAAANSVLEGLAYSFFQLRRELHRSKDPVLKERLAIIGKVFRGLNELSVPLARLESSLQAATRPGLFPVRCLERWLQVAEKGSCQYGETETDSRYLIKRVSEFHSLMLSAVSGKATWLHQHLQNARATLVKTLVLCGSPHEVGALAGWLDDTLDTQWNETIQLAAMDGVKAFRQYRGVIDEVVITGMLWPSRQHWLATPCRKLTIPVYAYEVDQMQRLLHHWWQEHGAASRSDGDKLIHWQLDWGDTCCEDSDTIGQPLILSNIDCPNHGEYPPRTHHAFVPLNVEAADNWLELLLEEPAEPIPDIQGGEASSVDLVWITTLQSDTPLPWVKSRPVLVLKDDDIHPTRPEHLEEGDQIILLKYTDERVATQEKLFEMVAVSEGIQQFIRAAARWTSMVDTVSARYKPAQVQLHLKKENVNVSDATVSNWYRHNVYGPRDRAAVLVFARLAGLKQPESTAAFVANAIEQLRSVHQQVGRQLRKALLERSKGATTVSIGQLTMDGHAFDDMIEISTVRSVRLPTTQIVAAKEEGLADVLDCIIRQHPERIHLTIPALKSMRDSVYRDTDKFRACLLLMATKLYDHYRNRDARLHDVLEYFKRESIEFQPRMSSVTMGQFSDHRKYKGRPADLNRHFCLGNARDPARTLRIHFDWDEEDKLLVIHHAGKHLETTQS
ncbi:DISARM anti-phage system protein DrmE domain-containing protein [Pseudomonas sp. MWU318]|uniref:DISARM anti-phage system protein DrmE domain-containing protein n=1 Tax=Pseudomonas sp. MWU318 TaxID=2802569 RepID=UPI001926853E|nr:hypothetical protein [Pseudomonas sp. MWU318]